MEPTAIEPPLRDITQSHQERLVDEQEQLGGLRVILYLFLGNLLTIAFGIWYLLSP